ncbi:hypothetical protein IMZ08_15355 [Bacillus luteolus]|uniref:Uncharacterized protein n=1 Tax=Litchfieldia luteola TaxID=682179 RepID=A0ABR9QLN9_9BACI|nr:hypothetical protein [Cytobacillus luteolus]MBE4909428.1 hypothetical protein [Cytobacillus luteolus]MBP1940828.1 phosphoglycerate-specific signal transduction histidine kinase [Cytobacillus luteolus]
MSERELEMIQLFEKVVDEKLEKHFNQLKQSTTEISNANGTASILKSGNSIVYIDNSGIAYAMLLFFYQMMNEKDQKNLDMNEVLSKIEERMSKNRKSFEELISSVKESQE